MAILAGLQETNGGFAEIAGFDARDASRIGEGNLVALARQPEIFCGSVLENIRLGRSWLSSADIRRALERVGLWEDVLKLPSGLESRLQTGGYPLTYSQTVRLTLARAICSTPSILLIDGILDLLDPEERMTLWAELEHCPDLPTIVIATHDMNIAAKCKNVLVCQHDNLRTPSLENPTHG